MKKIWAPFLLGVTACGADSNIWGLTTPEKHKESFDVLIAAGRAAYDRNDLAAARKHADKAFAINPNSERAAMLYGYTYLSLAGADPFSLAFKIIESEDDSSEDESSDTDSDNPGADSQSEEGSSNSSSSTADTLDDLGDAMGFTDGELLLLATEDNSDPDFPLLIPKCAEEARVTTERLNFVDKAVKATCQFVDPGILVTSDLRQRCEPFSGDRLHAAKAHFLWAFAHLAEALSFNRVLTYATVDPTKKKTNLELKVDSVKSQQVDDPTQIGPFIESMQSLEKTVAAVLPLKPQCSENYPTTQLIQTLNDLLAVDRAFRRLPGMPPKITAKIQKAMEKINALQGTGDDLQGEQAQTLKGDMTKKMSKELSAKIDSLSTESGEELSPEQTAEVCTAYESISGGSEENQPLACGGSLPATP